MSTLDIRKIWAHPELMVEYRELELQIRSLDSGIPIPQPNHVAALAEMRRILSQLQAAEVE